MERRTFGSGGYAGPYRAGKFSLFEGGIRVPSIISWPNHLPEGEVRDQMAMNVDWFPTLVELCGISDENMQVDGKSLLPVINENKPTPHKALHFDFGGQWAVHCGDWKLINNPLEVKPNDDNKVLKTLFLSNLKEDPSEKVNLADKYPDKLKELLQLRSEYLSSLEK